MEGMRRGSRKSVRAAYASVIDRYGFSQLERRRECSAGRWTLLLSSVSALARLFLLALWGVVTFNRNTDNSLGIYELSTPGVEALFWGCFFGQPMLTVVMFIRMALRDRSAFYEIPLAIAIAVWGLFSVQPFVLQKLSGMPAGRAPA